MIGKKLKGLLALEAALCLLLGLSLRPEGEGLPAVLAFPFAPLGRALRALSLSGGAGNALAVLLYGLFCLLPALGLLLLLLKRRFKAEDLLLGLMSVLLFFQMYWMVNPSLLPGAMGLAAGAMGGGLLGCAFYTLLLTWLLFRFLRVCVAADGAGLVRCCSGGLTLLAAGLIFAAFALGPAQLTAAVRTLQEANTGGTGLTETVLVLGCLADGAVCLLDLWVLFAAGWLLSLWAEDPYGQETVRAAETLSRRGVLALCAGLLLNLAWQLLQLPLLAKLRTVSFSLRLPLLSVVLVLAALLLTRLLRQSKRLKDDNDLFI